MKDTSAELLSDLDEGVRLFGMAVLEHLAPGAQPDSEIRARIASRIFRLLDPEQLTDQSAASDLFHAPEILASFFQNADLLDATAESAQRVARMVTLALERAWEG